MRKLSNEQRLMKDEGRLLRHGFVAFCDVSSVYREKCPRPIVEVARMISWNGAGVWLQINPTPQIKQGRRSSAPAEETLS